MLFSEAAAANPRFDVTWGVIVDVLQGMAIGQALAGDEAPTRQLALLEALAEEACRLP